MFTGIVRDIGQITAIDKKGDWVIDISTALPLGNTEIGASISHSGICLTVIEKQVKGSGGTFRVQLSQETLSKTTALRWEKGGKVNLEPALRVGDELGGHYVSGHVDGIARVVAVEPSGESRILRFDVPLAFARYIAPKGSVTLDGVSLTVNDVDGAQFSVTIIPHTQKMTTLGRLTYGDECNFEVDMVARYVDRLRSAP